MQAAIQTALFSRLNGASLGATVVDYMPQSADGGETTGFPYVVMGRIIFTEDDTQTRNGGSFIARIHTHTRDGSMVGCKAIQDAIFAALHRQEMTVTGANNFSLLRNDTDTQHMGDGRVHGICEFRGLIETS
tara:strand:+ start:717 stop:1112 length:396 start_codon:yes stop_codon:yes gene_type:complete